MPKTTLRHVADACRIGLATASRALSGHPSVAAATRTRVRQKARELGYERNPGAA